MGQEDTYEHDVLMETAAGRVLLTGNRSRAKAFAASGGCVIGLCPEDALQTVDFPEACLLAAEGQALSEAFIEQTACHFYGKPFTIARTGRLVIRESTEDDHASILSILQRCAGNSGQQIFRDGFSIQEIGTGERFLQYVQTCYHFFGFGMWTVLLKDEEKAGAQKNSQPERNDLPIVGWCGLFPEKDEGEAGFHAEMGYAVDPDHQRKGLALEACRAILAYAAEATDLAQVVIRADLANRASVRLAQQLGFSLHRTDRESGTGVYLLKLRGDTEQSIGPGQSRTDRCIVC